MSQKQGSETSFFVLWDIRVEQVQVGFAVPLNPSDPLLGSVSGTSETLTTGRPETGEKALLVFLPWSLINRRGQLV